MILKRLSAENFRNIEKCDIHFSEGVNLLHGNNAEGKTNAVEGIYLFARGRSFRAREDSELIRFGTQGFRIYIEYEDKDGVCTLEYANFGKEKRRKKNGYRIAKVTEMLGSFKCVLFYPDDLRLVKGGPEERRSFLNVALSQCYPSYIKCYQDYKKALENRNCILKFMSKGMYVDPLELESWSRSLAYYASYIYIMREEYIKKLSPYCERIMKEISLERESIKISYENPIEANLAGEESIGRDRIEEEYIRLYRSNTDREAAAGVTLFGPHRDDLRIGINGKDSRYFASQGQQRSIVLSLKLAEGELIKELFGEYPVFLFDDVLSELDEGRRNYVISGIGEKQIIITSCDPDDFKGIDVNKIDVIGGRYVHSHR